MPGTGTTEQVVPVRSRAGEVTEMALTDTGLAETAGMALHWDGSAMTTGMAFQARICVPGPGSANPLDRWQSTWSCILAEARIVFSIIAPQIIGKSSKSSHQWITGSNR